MEKKVIRVDQRAINTKHSVRGLRKEGLVPGILYGRKLGNIPISVQEKDLTGLGGAHLVEVVLPGGSYNAIVREVQREPIHKHIRHVDFQQVDLNSVIKTEIRVSLIGEPRGALEGGVIQSGERSLEVEGFPADIPDMLEVDISGLDIGDKITVSDLSSDLSYKIISDPDTVLAVMVSTRGAVEAEVEEVLTHGEEKTTEDRE